MSINRICYCVCLTLLFKASIDAAPVTDSPHPDFKGVFNIPTRMTLTDEHSGTFNVLTLGLGLLWHSKHDVIVNVPTAIYGTSYTTGEPTGFNPQTSTFVLTDVIGMDLEPSNPADLHLVTGFSATNPQFQPLGPVIFTGASGTEYISDVNITTTIGNLGTTLGPGFDIRHFVGDPASIVYVSQTTVPISDAVIVPEPNTAIMPLFAFAALMINVIRKRLKGVEDRF